jgi:hypothetical protein
LDGTFIARHESVGKNEAFFALNTPLIPYRISRKSLRSRLCQPWNHIQGRQTPFLDVIAAIHGADYASEDLRFESSRARFLLNLRRYVALKNFIVRAAVWL